MNAHLSLNHVNKYFGNMHALKDVSLSVDEGKFICLLGPSGCGKTTLLRIIAGFEHATSGDILLKNKRINEMPPHKREFGMVFQSLALFPHMTVAENIAYGMKRKGIAKTAQRNRINELLEMVKLPDIANRQVTQLSGGQQQRVAIARALAVPPKLFLLDEPLSALDAQIRENMQIELRQLQQNFGVTTVLVTHDQHEAMMLADELVVLKNGEVQQVASPSDMYNNPSNEFVASFLGAANLLPGIVTENRIIDVLGKKISFSDHLPDSFSSGQHVKVGIRGEDILLQPVNPAEVQLVGKVTFIRNLGAKTEVLVKIGETTIRCHTTQNDLLTYKNGDAIALQFSPLRCTVFKSS